jgi:outer membrane receptor protein involved in Fe transport
VRNLYGIGPFATLNISYPGSSTVGQLEGSYRDSNISPEATLTWRPDRDHTVYIAYKTAFKSGGFTLAPIQTTTRIADQDFGPERAKGFEMGAKAAFAGGRGRATLTAFHYNFNGQQVSIYDAINGRFIISNAGSVRQRGVSGTVNMQATEMLNLHGAFTYARNRFRDFVGQCYGYTFPTGTVRATAVPPPNCSFVSATSLTLQQDYNGRAPARSPEFTANAGAALKFDLGGMALDVTGDSFYSDGYYASDNLNPGSYQSSFWRFNAGVTLHGQDDRWQLALIGRNLTNKYYLQFASDRTGGASVASTPSDLRSAVARGREVALQGTLSF